MLARGGTLVRDCARKSHQSRSIPRDATEQEAAPGKCTDADGIMSSREIRQFVKDDNITPIFNKRVMVKYYTYAGDS